MTQEEIDKAIKECRWKNDFDICKGMCLPCQRVIERGQCDTLIELFGKGRMNDRDMERNKRIRRALSN